MNFSGRTTLVLLLTLAAPLAFAGDGRANKLEIRGAFSRATAANADPGVAGAFMTITNTGSETDQLIGVSSAIADTGGAHTHVRNGNVLNMVPVGAIDLPAGHTVTLQPGGMHVMFHGLKQPLQQGGQYSLTLQFAKAGAATLLVEVLNSTAMSYPGGPAAMAPGMTGMAPMAAPMGAAPMSVPIEHKP